jgi:hypothetical protein
MDLREYDYIENRSDTLPGSTLKSIQKVLAGIGSDSAVLIDEVLKGGYIEPPAGYKWQGCYKITLSRPQIETIFRELIRAEGMTGSDSIQEKKSLGRLKRQIACWSRVLNESPETYESYKSKQAYYDLRDISFDAFLDLIFDRPVADKAKKEKEWYWKVGINRWIEMDRPHLVDLYAELFSRSDELPGRYSKDKLEQGFWFMMGGSLEFTPDELIRDDELSIDLKERLIKSMYFLYEKFFYDAPLQTSSYMWWDSFAYSYCVPGSRDPVNNEEHRRIQDTMFHTLVRILALDSEICQVAALHGLGHLRHPDTKKVIEDFMKRHPNLTEKQIDYCNNCITGHIM